MFREHRQKDEVARYVTAVRARLDQPDVKARTASTAAAQDAPVQDPADQLRAALAKEPLAGSDAESAFFARNPATSLMQTALDEERRRHERGGLVGWIGRFLRRLLHAQKFGPEDPNYITDVALAMAQRVARGNHPFNPHPAEYVIEAADPLILIVGDWGSGLEHAQMVAALMATRVEEALAANRSVHVIHLGDVYYSGDPGEYRRRVLKPGLWPVTPEQAARGVSSWALNGNHDMYAGGWGYFGTLLADVRFAAQHSTDGHPTSYFRIRTPGWDIVGLDTAWDPDVFTLGQQAVLEDPQAAKVAQWADESSNKLMLLSHHQYVTAYDHGDIGPVLDDKLGALLAAGRVTAWLWGHEHRCMAFTKSGTQPYMRCIGHGGIPTVPAAAGNPPPPGLWQVHGDWSDRDGTWANFGYAALDFQGADVLVSYFDDQGNAAHDPERF